MPAADLALSEALIAAHPADAARVLESTTGTEAAAVLAAVPPGLGARVLEVMVWSAAVGCLGALPPERAAAILAETDLDAAASLLRRVDDAAREALLAAAPYGLAAPLRSLLSYHEGTAGAMMDPKILTLPSDIAVAEARERVARSPRHALYYLYVVDRGGGLVGVLNLRELLLADPAQRLTSVMQRDLARIDANADLSRIVEHEGWSEYHALPVVDARGVFLGAIRYETLRRLEGEAARRPAGERAVSVAVSLGELYWIGLSGVIEGLGSAALRRSGEGRTHGR